MAPYKTEQENFWAGEFGVDYIDRNNYQDLIYPKTGVWAKMLRSTHGIKKIREFGCNIGLNLVALKRLQPNLILSGYEINPAAARKASEFNVAEITEGSIIEPMHDEKVDLTFTSGVLIHINPDYLDNVYANLVNMSNKYVIVSEYYNPTPVEIQYRGHKEKMFKRDFAGELIDKYNLKLVDYGFMYHRDKWAPHDDFNWFLLEK